MQRAGDDLLQRGCGEGDDLVDGERRQGLEADDVAGDEQPEHLGHHEIRAQHPVAGSRLHAADELGQRDLQQEAPHDRGVAAGAEIGADHRDAHVAQRPVPHRQQRPEQRAGGVVERGLSERRPHELRVDGDRQRREVVGLDAVLPRDRAQLEQPGLVVVERGGVEGERGARLPLAQLDAVDGTFVGTTSYYAPDADVRSVAIGYTWLAGWVQGRGHNADSKLQLLAHAFERLGAEVVVWHTDALNAHSRAAIEKLGAHHDGVLRHHKRRPDGTVRDTACFSLLADEWPAARERLEGRVTTALHP